MTITPTDLTRIAVILLAVIVLASRDDPRAWNWIKSQWATTVGAWFARRRERKALNQPVPGWHNFKVR